MYWLSVSALGTLYYFYCKGKKKYARHDPDQAEPAEIKTEPAKEKPKAQEKIKDASAPEPDPDNPLESLKSMDSITDPWDRHMIYTQSIDLAYKKRKADPDMRGLVKEYGTLYVNEFPELKAAVTDRMVPVFKQLAITLEEDKAYEKAVNVCMTAITHELDDGTKTGFEGRMERIRKKIGSDN